MVAPKWTHYDVRSRRHEKVEEAPVNIADYPSLADRRLYNHSGVTRNKDLVIYNRVPKSGSSTFEALAEIVLKQKRMTRKKDHPFSSHSFSMAEEETLKNAVKSFPSNTFYNRHFYFVDLYDSSLGGVPYWVNTIRDPIKRFESEFHYLREPRRWMGEKPDQVSSTYTCVRVSLTFVCRFRIRLIGLIHLISPGRSGAAHLFGNISFFL